MRQRIFSYSIMVWFSLYYKQQLHTHLCCRLSNPMKKHSWQWLELILTLIAFFGIWYGLSQNGGGPIYSDELLYVDASLADRQIPSYGNRYFHIYLQKLFMTCAKTPIAGIRVYWAFLMSSTALCVYWSARIFLRHSNVFHGCLAAALFFSYRFVSSYMGIPSVDIAAMMMSTFFLLTYILYQRWEKRWLLFVLGMLSFLSFKTKETTLFINMLLLGLFFDRAGKFAFSNIKPHLRTLLLGFAAGVLCFILLDSIFLKNPFFSIHPTTFRQVLANYDYERGFFKEPINWYSYYLLDELMFPFLLYVVSGIWSREMNVSPQMKLVWLFPLLLLSFITVNMLKIPWGFIERFFFPALPVLSILAPQFLKIEPPPNRETWFQYLVVGTGCVLTLFGIRLLGMTYVDHIDWNYGKFLLSIIFPIMLSLILGWMFFVKKQTIYTLAVFVICLGTWVLPQLSHNFKYIYIEPTNTIRYELKFYPLLTYQNEITITEDIRMAVSVDIFESSEVGAHVFSNNHQDVTGMLNVLYDARVDPAQVEMLYQREKIAEQIAITEPDYVFLSIGDWYYLEEVGGESLLLLQEKFTITLDDMESILFLKRKDLDR